MRNRTVASRVVVSMTPTDAHETSDWPQAGPALLDRTPALAALEEAWRSGLLAENEPSAN